MKLYRSDGEIEISGSVEELQKVYKKIDSIQGKAQIVFEFDTNGSSGPYDFLESNLIVIVTNGPAIARYIDDEGVVIEGNVASLKVLASFFDFDLDTEAGCHYHWDEACDSQYVAPGTLPIVISIA
ncbi:hypothetical protein [Vibrio parahaemolyticus]|uniref:hypothetical protein n=1 Tax=Vibrio parahaemolyticus TaxID=670 RepID=UPI001124BBA5|nr:hypothetical protein [Vibrio parahaemolyticus]EHR6782928.1 hypothetical protein [Vibrio parahaemolyticus]TOH24838.1 hypothetical protein CGI83_23685 [Vibrio parahaemolyticus]HCG9147150.1 hypothetical protein [Vibrio parahaemolyticus]